MYDGVLPVRMEDKDLLSFVMGFCDGQIFTNQSVSSAKEVPLSFLPIYFSKDKVEWENVGLLWEWRRKSRRGSINGNPIFDSVQVMHKEDWRRAQLAIKRELARREKVEL
jgi:hypothetical protein